MALLLPLLLLILMGILEYGWMFWKNQEINNAARHGARTAVIEGATTGDVTTAIDTLMDRAGLASSGYTIEIEPADVFIAEPGSLITVTVTVPYANITLTGVPMLPVPDDLGGET
jgi:Flp pilus assembly protein TadG